MRYWSYVLYCFLGFMIETLSLSLCSIWVMGFVVFLDFLIVYKERYNIF